MTADERLNQLEPVMADMVKSQANLTAQNQALAKMLFDATVLMMEIKKELSKTDTKLDRLANDSAEQFEKLTATITAIYQAVQKPSSN
jgi:septal ring factor EnvC (AmiA/AmiB activator)